jgi:flagellar motor switch protein FliN
MTDGIVEDSGGMLTQEALDSMLANMTAADADSLAAEMFAPDEPVATQASRLVEASAAAASESMAASHNPALSFMTFNEPGSSNGMAAGFDRVQDIALEITVELGRTRMLIKDILELTSGSIIELEKIAGEPVDLLANGLLIARGEVVVVEDSFGVRITQVITAADRRDLANSNQQKSQS